MKTLYLTGGKEVSIDSRKKLLSPWSDRLSPLSDPPRVKG